MPRIRTDRGTAWIPLYQYLRTQPLEVEIPWRQLSEIAGHDIKRHRGTLVRARAELVQDGLTLGGQSPSGLWVEKL